MQTYYLFYSVRQTMLILIAFQTVSLPNYHRENDINIAINVACKKLLISKWNNIILFALNACKCWLFVSELCTFQAIALQLNYLLLLPTPIYSRLHFPGSYGEKQKKLISFNLIDLRSEYRRKEQYRIETSGKRSRYPSRQHPKMRHLYYMYNDNNSHKKTICKRIAHPPQNERLFYKTVKNMAVTVMIV